MKSERTKELVFRTALKLFSQNGYASTTIRRIADEAELSLGLLYRYFPSKEALAKAVLQYCVQLILEDLGPAPDSLSFRDLYSKAKSTVGSDLDLWNTWNNLRREPSLKTLATEIMNEALAQLSSVISPEASTDLLLKLALTDGLLAQEATLNNLPIDKMIDRADSLFQTSIENESKNLSH